MMNYHTRFFGGFIMATEKIAITLDRNLLREIDRGVKSGVFKNRSRAIEEAVKEKIERQKKSRLLVEAKKLDPDKEKALAEEGMTGEEAEWPEY
jgi:Arc/MetJ-type ribon-helix-helix transcriptional regulator